MWHSVLTEGYNLFGLAYKFLSYTQVTCERTFWMLNIILKQTFTRWFGGFHVDGNKKDILLIMDTDIIIDKVAEKVLT